MNTTTLDAVGNLPRWDLSDLYAGLEDDALARDMATLQQQATAFAQRYQATLATLPPQQLAEAICAYEALQDMLAKIGSYADLVFAVEGTDAAVAAACQNLHDGTDSVASLLVFFTLELNRLEETSLHKAMAQCDALAHYAPWLRDIRAYLPHQLDEALERLFIDTSAASNGAWVRLYEDLCNKMRIPLLGKTRTLNEVLETLSHTDPSHRQQAAQALSATFEQHADQFALIFNTIMKDKAVQDRWRQFARPADARHLANLVEGEIVDTLAHSVHERYAALSQRYYRLKARMMGKERLAYWDRNAPVATTERDIPWERARDMVLASYREFSPRMADIAETFFDKRWIDAPASPGKTSGAFSHPVSTSTHPYILLNYHGKMRDVMTLAHELGHGVHQMLARSQGALMADTPLTLAETASVFGEQLTFRYLLAQEEDAATRRSLMASKIEDMLNTVVRQIAFYRFETRLHDARREGELSPDTIRRHWMETQAESFGDAIVLDDTYANYWMYISHFFHAPFYVYAYAFGDCLVNSLYAVYEEEKARGAASAFEGRYIEMLATGGAKRHRELLAPFGLDISQPDFWAKGLAHIGRTIDLLEETL